MIHMQIENQLNENRKRYFQICCLNTLKSKKRLQRIKISIWKEKYFYGIWEYLQNQSTFLFYYTNVVK